MTEKTLSTMANCSQKDQKNSWRNRLRLFLNPFDARFEDMQRENWLRVAVRDTSAGLIVAMMAI